MPRVSSIVFALYTCAVILAGLWMPDGGAKAQHVWLIVLVVFVAYRLATRERPT